MLVGSAADAGPLLHATWFQDIEGVQIFATETFATCTDFWGCDVQTLTCPSHLSATGSATATSYSVSLTLPLFAFP